MNITFYTRILAATLIMGILPGCVTTYVVPIEPEPAPTVRPHRPQPPPSDHPWDTVYQ